MRDDDLRFVWARSDFIYDAINSLCCLPSRFSPFNTDLMVHPVMVRCWYVTLVQPCLRSSFRFAVTDLAQVRGLGYRLAELFSDSCGSLCCAQQVRAEHFDIALSHNLREPIRGRSCVLSSTGSETGVIPPPDLAFQMMSRLSVGYNIDAFHRW